MPQSINLSLNKSFQYKWAKVKLRYQTGPQGDTKDLLPWPDYYSTDHSESLNLWSLYNLKHLQPTSLLLLSQIHAEKNNLMTSGRKSLFYPISDEIIHVFSVLVLFWTYLLTGSLDFPGVYWFKIMWTQKPALVKKSILYCICNIFPDLIVHCKYTNKKFTIFKFTKSILAACFWLFSQYNF